MKSNENGGEICTYLDWDSRFFQHRIARLNRQRLDQDSLSQVMAWCGTNRIECLYFLADSDDAETARLAEHNEFQQTDVRITFERVLAEPEVPKALGEGVRPAAPRDLDALRAIARHAHRQGRFYFDQHFASEQCDLFYQTWIERSLEGYAQAVLVAEVNAEAVGYITCHLHDGESRIGLAGVSNDCQKMGLGKKLTESFLTWSVQQAARRATVVTQGRNVRAQRLYQRSGFVTESVKLWCHRWFNFPRANDRSDHNQPRP